MYYKKRYKRLFIIDLKVSLNFYNFQTKYHFNQHLVFENEKNKLERISNPELCIKNMKIWISSIKD